MAIRAVIFDRDGVLTEFDIDTAQAFLQPRLKMSLIELAQRWVTWGDVIGTPTNEVEEVDLLQGFWTHVSELEGLSEDVWQELCAFDYLDVIRPFADAYSALQYCKQLGLKVGVLSNFSLATLDKSLQIGGLAQWVDYAAAAPVIGYAKPQAESYEYVAKKLGVSSQECLLLDDEPSYVTGAQSVGMCAYLVNRRLLDHDIGNYVIRDLTALPTILEGIV